MLQKIQLSKIQKLFLSFFIFYTIFGFFATPYLLKSQITQTIEAKTNAKITIEDIYFNPFTFTLIISNFDLKSLENQPLVAFKSMYLNLEPSSIFRPAFHIKEFVLAKPEIFVAYNKDKSFNFISILKPNETRIEDANQSSSFHMPRLMFERVSIEDGTLKYDDFSKQNEFDFIFEEIGFTLADIDTNDFNVSDGKLKFYSKLGDAGYVDFKSQVSGFDPFKLHGTLDVQNVELYSVWRYFQDLFHLEVADGKLSLHSEYALNLDDINATTLSNISLSLENLRLKPKKSSKDILTLDALYLKDGSLKPLLKDIHIQKVELNSLNAHAKRDKNAQIDWSEYLRFNQHNTQTATNEETNSSNQWSGVIETIALTNIQGDFRDEGVTPNVTSKLSDLNISMQNVTLAGDVPLQYQLVMHLNKNVQCSSEGSVKYDSLDMNSTLKCSGLDALWYRPYLDAITNEKFKVFDLKLESLMAGFDANVNLKESDSQTIFAIKDANVMVEKVALSKKSSAEKLLDFGALNLQGISLDTKTREIQARKIALGKLNIYAKRYKNKTFSVEDLIVPHAKAQAIAAPKSQNEEKEYSFFAKHLHLDNASLKFDDKALTPSVQTALDKINFDIYDANSKKESWLKYNLSVRVNYGGYAKSKGSLRHTPLKQKGTIELQNISLKELTPYLGEIAYLTIDDGSLSLKANMSYAKSSVKADLRAVGTSRLEDFFVSDTRDDTPILSLSEVKLGSFTYEMAPNRFFVDEVDVNSFYVNALIDENKKMNLASLMKQNEDANSTKTEDSNQTQEKFPLKIMKVNVALGSANFSDLSLPIKFKTNIHDLNGSIYGLSNAADETSYVDMAGEVDRYGSTKLRGSINSGDLKSFTDLDFSFKNLDLESMSGYSASFSGYKIDNGKLFLDLEYDILNSELLGKNNILIKNIELGEELRDENQTLLPLGFVIALLEDSEGVIDINMPVNGNVDDPDFKYGALVWKTFGKLVLKAVASPFSILGSIVGGDGDKMEYLEFEGGSLTLLPPEQEKLDNIAKLLTKRPKISLGIHGGYDTALDKRALQKEKLSRMVIQKSGVKSRENQLNVTSIDLMEDLYEEFVHDNRLYSIAKELKGQFKGEEYNRAYASAVFEECLKFQSVSEGEMQTLARKRADVVRAYLIEKRGVEVSRIKILEIAKAPENTEKFVKTTLQVDATSMK